MKKSVQKQTSKKMWLLYGVGVLIVASLVHKYVFAEYRLQKLKSECSEMDLYYYGNDFVMVSNKGFVFDGGYRLYDKYGRLLESGGGLGGIIRTPWYLSAKLANKGVNDFTRLPSKDFCMSDKVIGKMGIDNVRLPFGWKVRESDTQVTSGEKPFEIVQEDTAVELDPSKESSSYLVFFNRSNGGDSTTYKDINEWLDSVYTKPSLLPDNTPRKMKVLNKRFADRSIDLAGPAPLDNAWVEVNTNIGPTNDRKGEYVAFMALVKNTPVEVLMYINPNDSKVVEMTKILNSIIINN